MSEANNLLIRGDNLAAGPLLRERFKGAVDLVYIDPPFATGRDFRGREALAYRDRWGSSPGEFLAFLEPRLALCCDLLAPGGSLYVHLDYRRVHHARLLLDRLLGEDRFRNEIIWHYRSGGRGEGSFAFKHDTILTYGKSAHTYFDGASVMIPRGARSNHMKRGVDEGGRAYRSIRSGGKEYRYYEDEGVIPDDVWSDIGHLQQRDPERTGYPTQKPEALLERVVRASSPPGGLVMDLFCGSGTTLAVAGRLGRRWVGCDQGALAIETCQRRLAGQAFEQLEVG
jgi:site-specific DNA-methyltransferase (adenine-specific)/adenine-specific DNA-methyltransferase